MLARHVFLRHIQVPSAERESVAVDTASNKLTHVYAFRSRSRKLERYGIYALKKTPPPPPLHPPGQQSYLSQSSHHLPRPTALTLPQTLTWRSLRLRRSFSPPTAVPVSSLLTSSFVSPVSCTPCHREQRCGFPPVTGASPGALPALSSLQQPASSHRWPRPNHAYSTPPAPGYSHAGGLHRQPPRSHLPQPHTSASAAVEPEPAVLPASADSEAGSTAGGDHARG